MTGNTQIQQQIRKLKSQNDRLRYRAADTLAKIGERAVHPLAEALNDEDPIVDSLAAQALGKIGPNAKAAVPALLEGLYDEDKDPIVGSCAAEALGKIGPHAVPALVEALNNEHEDVRSLAAKALGKIGPDAKATVPALLEALNDEDEDVRSLAAEALGKIGPDAVPALVEALNNEHEDVRRHAARALGEIGPDAKAAVPVLLEVLNDEDEDVCECAAEALGKIGPDAKAAVPILTEVLKRSSSVAIYAQYALAQITGTPQNYIAALVGLLQDRQYRKYDEDHDWWYGSAVDIPRLLMEIGKAAIPAVLEALQDEEPFVRRSAVRTLVEIADRTAIPALTKALKDRDEDVPTLAAEALGKIGPDAAAAVPALTRMAKRPGGRAAREALKKITKGDKQDRTPEDKFREWYRRL